MARTISKTGSPPPRDAVLRGVALQEAGRLDEAERAFLAVLDGSCRTPIAGLAEIHGDRLRFRGLILSPDGREAHAIDTEGDAAEAAAFGRDAGKTLRDRCPPGFRIADLPENNA